MKSSTLTRSLLLAASCVTFALTAQPAAARDVRGHAGTTFVLQPVEFDQTGFPTRYTHAVDGVVRVSGLGNCTFHADVIITQATPTSPMVLAGPFLITTADGGSTLKADAIGVGTPDPANPNFFLNFHYDLKFTGGTGAMANARGKGDVDGFAMFTAAATETEPAKGKATWVLSGEVNTHRPGR